MTQAINRYGAAFPLRNGVKRKSWKKLRCMQKPFLLQAGFVYVEIGHWFHLNKKSLLLQETGILIPLQKRKVDCELPFPLLFRKWFWRLATWLLGKGTLRAHVHYQHSSKQIFLSSAKIDFHASWVCLAWAFILMTKPMVANSGVRPY